MDMIHVILKYLEVYTDINFIIIPTMPMQICSGINIEKVKCDGATYGVQDDAQVGTVSNDIW